MNDPSMQKEEYPKRVGLSQPRIREDWMLKNPLWRLLARCDYGASYFFFWFNTIAIVRFVIESVAVAGLVFAIVGVIGEFQQRQTDRGIRIATLFAQIAEIHALPDGKGLHALGSAVEALAREGVPMHGINLSGAHLLRADLRGVDLFGADLSEAFLRGADLRNANLMGAKLNGADLYKADLTDADFFGTDISDTNLRDVIGLSEKQLHDACWESNHPPRAELSIPWTEEKAC